MNAFSFRRAWSEGFGFFSGQAISHAILLVGMGVLLPVALNAVLMWSTTWSSAPPALNGVPSVGRMIVGGSALSFQTAALFASWRLGLARGETLRGALLFGLLVGLTTTVGFGLALVAVGTIFGMITPLVAAGAVLVAFVGLFGIVWTAYSAMFAVAICLMFLLSLATGAAMGDMTYAATIVGGSGFVWTLLVAGAFVLLWLAARFSCTAVLLAERRSLNGWVAIRESWSLTWEDEWRITRYLGLLGLVMTAGILAVAAFASIGLARMMPGEGGQLMIAAVWSLLYIPLIYVAAMVPVGIYRTLAPADVAAAEVFV